MVAERIMIGYAPSGYRLWSVGRKIMIIARDVKFTENNFWYRSDVITISITENNETNEDERREIYINDGGIVVHERGNGEFNLTNVEIMRVVRIELPISYQ